MNDLKDIILKTETQFKPCFFFSKTLKKSKG